MMTSRTARTVLIAGAVAFVPFAAALSGQEVMKTQPRDPNRLWCSEHGVYEDECVICHPELAGQSHGEPEDGHGHADAGLWCNEHNVAERECGICQPQLAPGLRPGEALKVRLPSRESAEKAGIRTASPRESGIAASVRVFCEVHYNQNRVARITPLAEGVIHAVHADVGQAVPDGELLVEIASSEVATAKRDYLTAIVNERLKRLAFERETDLLRREISAAQAHQQAEAEYEMAKLATHSAYQRLINFGFTEDEVAEVAETGASTSIVHVHAPFAGTLVERSAVQGEAVKLGTPLFTLVDLSSMWLTLSIPESKLALVQEGANVEAVFAAAPGTVALGTLTWIDSTVTEPSRMVQARAVVSNPDGRLRNNMFGDASIILSHGTGALTLPTSAVQRFEQRPFVFVKVEADLYELRRVEVGVSDRDRIQVVAGVNTDDAVVVTGSYTMMSEFLKSRLGAGCVDD